MTKEEKPQVAAPRTLDPGALKALAHPLRVRIFDVLSTAGPQTASSLAAIVGETSGATSYHLRALAAHDLIREVPGRGTGRERWWERPKVRIDFAGPSDSMSPGTKAAAQIVTAEFLRLRHEALLAYMRRSESDESDESDAWRDAHLIMTAGIMMTAAQTQELQKELTAVVEKAIERYRGQEGPDVRHVTVRADVFDLPVQHTRERTARAQETEES
ncbi:ArsR/SmtB family transcription factor [Microbacterium keratanolyticum]